MPVQPYTSPDPITGVRRRRTRADANILNGQPFNPTDIGNALSKDVASGYTKRIANPLSASPDVAGLNTSIVKQAGNMVNPDTSGIDAMAKAKYDEALTQYEKNLNDRSQSLGAEALQRGVYTQGGELDAATRRAFLESYAQPLGQTTATLSAQAAIDRANQRISGLNAAQGVSSAQTANELGYENANQNILNAAGGFAQGQQNIGQAAHEFDVTQSGMLNGKATLAGRAQTQAEIAQAGGGYDQNGNWVPVEQARQFDITTYGYDPSAKSTPPASSTTSATPTSGVSILNAGGPQGAGIPGSAPPAPNPKFAAAGSPAVVSSQADILNGAPVVGPNGQPLTLAARRQQADITAQTAATERAQKTLDLQTTIQTGNLKIAQDAQALADKIQTGQLTIAQAAQLLDEKVKTGQLSIEQADQLLRQAQAFGVDASGRKTLGQQTLDLQTTIQTGNLKIAQDAQALANKIQTGQLTIAQAAQALDEKVRTGQLSIDQADQLLRQAQAFGTSGPIAEGTQTLSAKQQTMENLINTATSQGKAVVLNPDGTVKTNADGSLKMVDSLDAQRLQLQTTDIMGGYKDEQGAWHSTASMQQFTAQQTGQIPLLDAKGQPMKDSAGKPIVVDSLSKKTIDNQANQFAQTFGLDRQKASGALVQAASSLSPKMRDFMLMSNQYVLGPDGEPTAKINADGTRTPVTASDLKTYDKAKQDFLSAANDAETQLTTTAGLQQQQIDADKDLKKATMLLQSTIALMQIPGVSGALDAILSKVLSGLGLGDKKVPPPGGGNGGTQPPPGGGNGGGPTMTDGGNEKLINAFIQRGIPAASASSLASYLSSKGITSTDDPNFSGEYFKWQNQNEFDPNGIIIPKTPSGDRLFPDDRNAPDPLMNDHTGLKEVLSPAFIVSAAKSFNADPVVFKDAMLDLAKDIGSGTVAQIIPQVMSGASLATIGITLAATMGTAAAGYVVGKMLQMSVKIFPQLFKQWNTPINPEQAKADQQALKTLGLEVVGTDPQGNPIYNQPDASGFQPGQQPGTKPAVPSAAFAKDISAQSGMDSTNATSLATYLTGKGITSTDDPKFFDEMFNWRNAQDNPLNSPSTTTTQPPTGLPTGIQSRMSFGGTSYDIMDNGYAVDPKTGRSLGKVTRNYLDPLNGTGVIVAGSQILGFRILGDDSVVDSQGNPIGTWDNNRKMIITTNKTLVPFDTTSKSPIG